MGYPSKELGTFFTITEKTVYKYVLEIRAEFPNKEYNLTEMSRVLAEYMLTNISRNIHTFTISQQVRLLPDIMKIKEEIPQGQEEDSRTKTVSYIPTKTPYKEEEVVHIEES